VLFSRRRHLLSFELNDSPNPNLLPGLNSWVHYSVRIFEICRAVHNPDYSPGGTSRPKGENMPVSDSTAGSNAVKISGLVEHYTKTLQGRGYGPLATHAYKRAVEHFIAWSAPDSDCVEIGEAPIRRFIDEHLGDCSCACRPQRGRVTALSALRHLQAILRATGSIPPAPPSFPIFIISELRDYCDFANDVCGLSPATLISRRQWIGRFLTHIFPSGGLDFSRLGLKGIRDFFATQCQGYQPGSTQVVASSVRSYLRFRALRHADPVEALLAAIPRAARWRLASLPEYLNQEELARLMSAFEQVDPQRQRDHAIVRCLVDLGLRSFEVAALRLEDIDWKNATLTIRVGKSRRADVLPLPAVTGHAIANYLHKARPATESRAVFVRHRAPLDVPVDAGVIRSVVRQAAARSGLAGRLHGPHRLRHSAATRMLQGGATLKEIADVLRHRSLDTTAIYAKVDLTRLSAIAQPWPGGVA
jgi:site-specific recombinase XerD